MPQLPTVDELTGAFWRRGWTPVPSGSTREQRSVAALAATQWREGPSITRERARHREADDNGADVRHAEWRRLYTERPSERARPCFSSAHPTPDLVSVSTNAAMRRASRPNVTDELAFFVVLPAALPRYCGDRGCALAQRLCDAWRRREKREPDRIFVAWLVERHSRKSARHRQQEQQQRERRMRTAKVRAGTTSTHGLVQPTLEVRAGAHLCYEARRILQGRARARVRLMQVQRVPVRTVHDARSVALAVCRLE